MVAGRVGGAFIQAHDDVRPQGFLDLHGLLRSDPVSGPVDMGLKLDSFFGKFDQGVEAEDLEPAAVGKQGMVPVHEAMDPSQSLNPFMPRPQVEVVGVGENDLRP